jgi:hypothetical protein
MRRSTVQRSLLSTACVIAAAAAPLVAHHSVLVFDGKRSVTVTGTLQAVVWENPHARLIIGDAAGQRWTVESESPRVLVRLGWTPQSLVPGDRISTVGAPSRTGARVMRCDFVRAPSGSRLPCYPAKSL